MSLWAVPAVGALVALPLALLLSRYRPEDTSTVRLLWPGGADAAAAILQVLAGSVVTVTSLTFSIVVVALQLASQQFSPRLLREFARDRATQGVLAVLLGTFVFAVTVLRGLHADRPLPVVALLVAYLLGILSVCALLAFLAHIMRALRVDTMMLTVHAETRRTIEGTYPAYDDPDPTPPGAGLPGPRGGVPITSSRSGFLQRLDIDGLVHAAKSANAFVRIVARAGDQILIGTPIASAWPTAGGEEVDDLAEDIRAGLELGYERTLEQDAAYGLRQLVDIAVKALSPGINDPVTAAHALNHLGDLLVRLEGRRLGPIVHCDDAGVPRVVAYDRDIRYYLELAFGQIRRYGAGEPTVLTAVLRALRDVGYAARDDEQREAVRREAALVVSEIREEMHDEDAAVVREAYRRVEAAVDGRVDDAYADRSGELRSI